MVSELRGDGIKIRTHFFPILELIIHYTSNDLSSYCEEEILSSLLPNDIPTVSKDF